MNCMSLEMDRGWMNHTCMAVWTSREMRLGSLREEKRELDARQGIQHSATERGVWDWGPGERESDGKSAQRAARRPARGGVAKNSASGDEPPLTTPTSVSPRRGDRESDDGSEHLPTRRKRGRRGDARPQLQWRDQW